MATDFRQYARARAASQALAGMLHEPPWLRAVRVVDGQIVVRVVHPGVESYLPSSINGLPIRIVVDGGH